MSAPHMTGYGIRACRDHWHVTRNGEDFATNPNELTREQALAFADAENFKESAWATVDWLTCVTHFLVGPRPSAPLLESREPNEQERT